MEKILILKIGALGDVIRTTYFLPGLKRLYGNFVEIYWITSNTAFELLEENKYIDKLIKIEDEKEVQKLENENFDWIISLEDEKEIFEKIENFKFKKLSGVYKKKEYLTYTEDLKEWFDMGLLSKYGKEKADILKKDNKLSHKEIFSKGLNIDILEPYFFNDTNLEKKINKNFEKYNKKYLIGLNLNAGKRWPSKALKVEEGKKLIQELLKDKKNHLFILGGKEELEINTFLVQDFIKEKNITLMNPCELKEFAAIIKNLDLLITSDTLALHLAIAQKVKTISYYAPTSAVEIDTFGNGEKIISEKEDYCSYNPFVDNSTITAEKILEKIKLKINL